MSFKTASRGVTPKKPRGWYTLSEVAKDMGVSMSVACGKVNALARAGRVEKMPRVVYDRNGRAAPSMLYRLVKK